MYYDEEFYRELSEFEQQIEEFKYGLVQAVQKEYLDKMGALQKENESLREFRDKKKDYERELQKTKDEYARKMQDAEMNANRKKLKELLALFSVTGYRVHIDYVKVPKCDKCDGNRKIKFKSPLGRDMYEDCTCAKVTAVYSVKEVPLVSFYAEKELGSVYFERTKEDTEYDRYDKCAELYDEDKKSFEEINLYRVVFLKKEDCQKYCDWKNKRRMEK